MACVWYVSGVLTPSRPTADNSHRPNAASSSRGAQDSSVPFSEGWGGGPGGPRKKSVVTHHGNLPEVPVLSDNKVCVSEPVPRVRVIESTPLIKISENLT